jgi:hypothetical protein
MTWSLVNQWTLVDDPRYKFKLDEWRDGHKRMMFIHLSFEKFSKAALAKFEHEFKSFRALTDEPLYAATHTENADDKFDRFVKRFGFKEIGRHPSMGPIYVSLKDNNNEQLVRHLEAEHQLHEHYER